MKPLKKNTKFIDKANDLTSSALAVFKVEDFPIFVKDSLPGEESEIIVTKLLRNYGFGRALKRFNDHPQRTKPICPLYPQCGGCQMMHMSYLYQLDFKHQRVVDSLKRNGDIKHPVDPILNADNPLYYRNKVMVPVAHSPFEAGFYRTNSHNIVDMDFCYIQSKTLNALYQEIKDFIRVNQLTQVKTIILREGYFTGEILVALSLTSRDTSFEDQFVNQFKTHEMIKSIQLTFNLSNSNVPISDEIKLLYGTPFIKEKILGLEFKLSLNSFFQINSLQTEKLYSKVLELAQIKSTDKVLDLYCGVGTMSLLFAKQAYKVYGVDIVEQAIEDAKRNALNNKLNNIEFIAMDATKFVNTNEEAFDLLVVDPPRKGLSAQGIQDILKLAAKRMIYVSCNPDTLARDLKLLSSGYSIVEITPVDMFSQTVHVETVVLMSRVEK